MSARDIAGTKNCICCIVGNFSRLLESVRFQVGLLDGCEGTLQPRAQNDENPLANAGFHCRIGIGAVGRRCRRPMAVTLAGTGRPLSCNWERDRRVYLHVVVLPAVRTDRTGSRCQDLVYESWFIASEEPRA